MNCIGRHILVFHPCVNSRVTIPSLNIIRFGSALKRASADFNQEVYQSIENNEIKPRKHPGIMTHGPYPLPKSVKSAVKKLLSEAPKKQLLSESLEFNRYLLARKEPVEMSNLAIYRETVANEVDETLKIDVNQLSEEELQKYKTKRKNRIDKILKQKVYNWKRLQFTNYMGLLYLVSRSAAEYAVISKIFKEINARTSFNPDSIFDFGSGVGSTIWAAHNLWGKSVKEYYCVESSSSMISLCENILEEFNDEHFQRRVFHRQFLPATSDVSSDIVISAYTLLELPSSADRLETVLNLWKRTKKYLVLVEQGNTTGFKVLNEVRNFMLSKKVNTIKKARIFAPCPHTLPCPRENTNNNCHFPVSYPCHPQVPEVLRIEYFSYIVFENETSDKIESSSWPRIVQPVLCRSGHTICRFCTASGDLKEVIFTKTNKIAYRCAKSSSWGDLVPCTIVDKENKKDFIEKNGVTDSSNSDEEL